MNPTAEVVWLRMKKATVAQWLLGLSGVISILFSLILFSSPEAGVVAMAWLIGLYAILFGVVLVMLGIRLRRHYLIFRSIIRDQLGIRGPMPRPGPVLED